MEERRATLLKGQLVHAVLASDEGTVGLNIYCIEVNKFSSIHTVGVVLCPASLLHVEKESGEMHMGCLDSVERGTEWNGGMVEWWNSGMVGGASLLNELEAKGAVLGLILLILEGLSTYLKASRLIIKLKTQPSSSTL